MEATFFFASLFAEFNCGEAARDQVHMERKECSDDEGEHTG